MQIVALSALPVASLLWQQRPGVWVFTVVSKATFTLQPGTMPLAPEQEPVSGHDRPWSDDVRSLYAASDLAPIKPRADVVLVGQAYAPGGTPARSLLARLTVGDVDKLIEINCDRALQPDGTIQEGELFTRMPLLYERAAGGAGTANPTGMSLADRDAYGRAALPNLQRPGVVVTNQNEIMEPLGFGPVPPSWPWRAEKLGRHANTWTVDQLAQMPLPLDIDPAHFNVAPPDQRTSTLRDDEHVFLDNLHPEHARLAAQLSGQRPVAFVERRSGNVEIALRPDTLWIDTARLICTLTWRGHVSLEHAAEEGRVLVAMAERGQTLTWADIAPRAAPAPSAPARAPVPAPAPAPARPLRPVTLVGGEATSMFDLAGGGASSLPFARPATALPPREAAASPPSAGLPFRSSMHAEMSKLAPPAPAPIEAPPLSPPAPPPRRSSESSVFPNIAPPPPVAPSLSAPAPAAVDSPWARASATSAAAVAVAAPWPTPAPAPVAAPTSAPTPSTSVPSTPVARVEPRLEPNEAIQLLWFDPESLPRIRRVSRWQKLLRDLDTSPQDNELDDPALAADPMELEDRREIFELLASGEATDAVGVNEAITTAIRDNGKFVPQLILVAGEIQLPFDELEALKATTTTVSPLVGQDEGLRVSVEAAKDFLKIPGLLSSAAVAEGLTGRIKESFGQGRRMVPAGYLDAQVERVLLEKRHYQRREVFGALHLRGVLHLPGSSGPVPTYLPEVLANKLPMYQRFKVRMVVQVEFSVDQYESHQAALRVVAIARIMTVQNQKR